MDVILNSPLAKRLPIGCLTAVLILLGCDTRQSAPSKAAGNTALQILNVSYDPTRELYEEMNRAFVASWKRDRGQELAVNMSHGGSGKQARAVIDGLSADVVTLALAYDVNAIAGSGLLSPDWQGRLPHNSTPYTSTIVFLVRKKDPRPIHDWEDLIQPGVSIITPNPKTSGGARWNYLAAWAYALRRGGGDQGKAKEFMRQLFRNVAVLDAGARAATTTFVERGIGNVLIAWESEARLALEKPGGDQFTLVVPSLSIVAEPPVAVVDQVARRKGTTGVASAYLEFLFSEAGQKIAARHHFRPWLATAVPSGAPFPQGEMVTVDNLVGGWAQAQAQHFAEGALFDQIFERGP